MKTAKYDALLSPHFQLSEFLNLDKHPESIPTMQAVANMTYGCLMLLEPARIETGPVIINSGFRCEAVNRSVGGVANSQHLTGQAADIRPRDPAQFQRLVALDVLAVLSELGPTITTLLQESKRVRIPYLGCFKLGIKTIGESDPEKSNARDNIDSVHVLFQPETEKAEQGKYVKSMVKGVVVAEEPSAKKKEEEEEEP